jgi:hypothetical protein
VGAPVAKTNVETTYASNQMYPLFAPVDSENIYWANLFSSTTGLVRVSLDGGAPVTLVHQNPYQVAVDDTSIYWTDDQSGTLSRLPKTGDTCEVFAFASAEHALALALDDGNVYWGTSDGFVVRATAQGADTVTLSASPGVPGNLAIDATSVYWAAGTSIVRVWPK